MREVKISPDGNAVAIRGDAAEDAWNAWAVMDSRNGGHWASNEEVSAWIDMDPSSALAAAARKADPEAPVAEQVSPVPAEAPQ